MTVELQGVSLTYQAPDGEVKALDNVSFGVNEGEFVSIVGPSGCGKSTLLSIMAGLEKPTGGSALLNGQPISSPSPKIGYMPQKDQLFPWRTIWGNITLGPELQKIKSGPCIDHINDLCRRYGIADFIKKTPSQLSGGMRQRCALIRTLALSPDILLLDEPFSALDYQTRLAVSADIYSIIRSEGKTAILVTHDISESVSLSDRVVVLSRRPGRVKSIHSLQGLENMSPMDRRNSDAFRQYFNDIWKELDINV